jgi:hypothetical protein
MGFTWAHKLCTSCRNHEAGVPVNVAKHDADDPYVMLSPNATKRVAEIFGGTTTVTVNPQESDRLSASFAVHATDVVPTGKLVPLSWVHVSATGAVPPATVGGA